MSEYVYEDLDTYIRITPVVDRAAEHDDGAALCQICTFASAYLGIPSARRCSTYITNRKAALLEKREGESAADIICETACQPKRKKNLQNLFLFR